jgi:diguanylate cyclase (GGDEF)-like protein/PAS domain S-box-containing protein
VSRLKTLAWTLIIGLCAIAAMEELSFAAPAPSSGVVDFAAPAAIIELSDKLTPYHAPGAPETDGSHWYMMTALNNSVRPATRIFIAGQPTNAVMRFWPLPARPAVVQVAASDSQVIVENARAHGRHVFRVTIPPASTVTLAVRLSNADTPPSVMAWTEPALVSYNRQLAVFVAAIAGMIAAAMAIMLGLAVMTGHAAPFWASLLLIMIFILRLATTGTFDAGWVVRGGPFGLEVALAGLALVVGLRLTDFIVPIETLWPGKRVVFNRGLVGLVVLSLLSFLGVPGAMTLMDILIVLGTGGITLYFVRCGRLGNQAARVAAPSAAVFSLVTLGAVAVAFGAFASNQLAPAVVGGFMAAGAVLLALAIAAGEGIAILPASRYGSEREEPPTSSDTSSSSGSDTTDLKAIGASHQGVFDLDFLAESVRLSREAATLTGFSAAPTTIPHSLWIERIHPDDRATYREAIDDYKSHVGIAFRIEFRTLNEAGRYAWYELRATMIGEGSKAERCLGLLADVTTRKEVDAAQFERNARDALTGLGNRVALMEALERLGTQLSGVTFALLDMDRFKTVHSSLGDAGSDAVLVGMAQRLTQYFSKTAEVFRVSGDTFALVFSAGDATNKVSADLMDACAAPFEQSGRNIFVTASAGLSAGKDARDPFELLKNAELALLQAKRQGGACARVYTPALEATAPGDAVALEADLRQALNDKQLDVYYQPIVRLSDGTLAGFEALMRWHHPEKGLIEPSGFIAHCEETGLIVAIGRLALERAAEDLAQWQRFFPLDPPLFASVNLSRRQLLDAEFERVLERVLAAHTLEPGTLKLEVTESAVSSGSDTRMILTRLRDAGASLAIDDFGTGVSNFQQLKEIPFDTVKLDRSFLGRHGGTHSDAEGTVILGSIVNLAHDLERDVVIEGVETEGEADWLRGLGCEYGQGFYFSAPLPRTEALDFIARHYRVATGQA